MATSTLKADKVIINYNEYVDGSRLPSTYPYGIAIEGTSGTQGDLPTNYATIVTFKVMSNRGFQLICGNPGIMAYRMFASNTTWGEWFTVSHT